MSYIETFPIQHSTILRLYSEKNEIQSNPEYQRSGGVWTPEKKQLLIDSILNNYDIPKIYFHEFNREEKKSSGYAYAVIDGRQRLEAIWQFIDGGFALSEDFVYQDDPSLNLAKMSYSDIGKEYPKIKIKFDSFVLPIVGVATDDLELIEDMFSRLNEAVPLNAAEKRNALGGNFVQAIREVAANLFFTQKVKFSNNRYQHYEVAARFLFIEACLADEKKIIDTKKVYLDSFARKFHSENKEFIDQMKANTFAVINHMSGIFLDNDELLRSQGNMAVYYLLFQNALRNTPPITLTRKSIVDFRSRVQENRILAELDFAGASYELLEFDRLTQQGTNDASNIKERLTIMAKHIGVPLID